MPGSDVRKQAIFLITGRGGRVILKSKDRAFAYRLYRESIIWRLRLDRALGRYCSKPLHRLDDIVLAALRIGAVQLLILGTPSHAAVSTTVEALEGRGGSGLVNAVLRKLSREGEPSLQDAPLHEIWSHPAALSERWIHRFGKVKAARLMEWNNSVPPIGGCVSDHDESSEKGLFLNDYRILPRTGYSPENLLSDDIYVQDEATAIVAKSIAELAEGGSVLEMGAAPGGKTHHICRTAEYVIALDLSVSRMGIWTDNMQRLRWKHSFPVVADGGDIPFSRKFDLVFIDAPCSNTGVYRRRFDARWKWSEELLKQSVISQKMLLVQSADAVVPGGILVYSTCSLEDEENLEQVEWFENNLSDFHRIRLPSPNVLVKDDLISIFPPDHGIDGIFAAAWRKDP